MTNKLIPIRKEINMISYLGDVFPHNWIKKMSLLLYIILTSTEKRKKHDTKLSYREIKWVQRKYIGW